MKRQEIDLNMVLPHDEQYHFDNSSDLIRDAIGHLVQHCHAKSYNAGWWLDPISGLSLIPNEHKVTATSGTYQAEAERHDRRVFEALFPYVVATKIALIHSEVSEMLEAERCGTMDDKLPEFAGVTAEGADVIIRVCDLLGMLTITSDNDPKYNLAAALLTKLSYNTSRVDHTIAARQEPGGKKY